MVNSTEISTQETADKSNMNSDNNDQDKSSDNQDCQNLSDILVHIKDNTDGDEISLGDILDVLDNRAYGPLLLVPSVIALSPIGAIPGMSIVTGSIILLIAGQMLFSYSQPWIPKKLLKISFERKLLDKSVTKMVPWIKKIETVIKSRLAFLTRGLYSKVNAIIIILLAVTMYPLAIVPWGVAVPSGALTLFSVGMTSKDGLLIIIGYVLTIVTAYLIYVAVL